MRHFTDEEKERAIGLYFGTGKTLQEVVDELGYPTRQCLAIWLKSDPRYGGDFRHGFYPISVKMEAIRLFRDKHMDPEDISKMLDIKCKGSIYNWLRRYEDEGSGGLVPKKRMPQERRRDIPDLPDDVDGLKSRCEELELENAIMREMLDVLKVDPCTGTENLTNKEKTKMVEALRDIFDLKVLLERIGLKRSSYYHARVMLAHPDKYAGPRERIHEIFADNQARYGYRRIWMKLRNGDDAVVISEKVVRKLMAEEGLVACFTRKRYRYSSYKGEISDAPANLINRDFSAGAPNEKWLTDITEMKAADGKLYLSPVIDCFDGMVVAWRMSRNPNAILANSMLEDAIATLPKGAHPLIHSDRGVHYRWDGWIDLMRRHGLVRSMSRKGCSPDNSAAEGMFGRLKVEMYYGAGWEKRTIAELEQAVDVYLHWYNEERIKMSLSGLSPLQYRRKLRLAT
jgi:transposase InsO family protein/transposase-like protein